MMNLKWIQKKLKLEYEIYSTSIEKTINIIDRYINLYKEYDSLYTDKWSSWVNSIKDDFIQIYRDLDFSLTSKKSTYDKSFEESTAIYQIAKYNTLQFELMLVLDKKSYNSVRFL